VREKGTQVDQGCNNVTHVRQGKIIFDGLESAERIWVVQRYYALVNKGDIDGAAAFIADDALFINPTGSYKSKAEIVASLRAQAKDGLTFDLSNFREKDGRVVYDYIVKAGSDALDKGTDGLTKIKDGKIVFDGTEKTEPAQ
jgi:ketosteroid isomerase-like protein